MTLPLPDDPESAPTPPEAAVATSEAAVATSEAAVATSEAAVLLPQPGPRAVKNGPSAQPQTSAYPWLLFLSTAMAAVFCFMYITKPEFPLAAPLGDKPPLAAEKSTSATSLTGSGKSATAAASMLPDAERLPGDSSGPAAAKTPQDGSPRHATPGPPAPPFEETNLHIQHVLTAAAPGGDLSRIVLNVPVLYQSRNLGWTESEVAESRDLLKRLATYQENSRALREEATRLLTSWNQLVERSIPTSVLRADSPSLPTNQDQAGHSGQPADLDTTQSIHIQPADK